LLITPPLATKAASRFEGSFERPAAAPESLMANAVLSTPPRVPSPVTS